MYALLQYREHNNCRSCSQQISCSGLFYLYRRWHHDNRNAGDRHHRGQAVTHGTGWHRQGQRWCNMNRNMYTHVQYILCTHWFLHRLQTKRICECDSSREKQTWAHIQCICIPWLHCCVTCVTYTRDLKPRINGRMCDHVSMSQETEKQGLICVFAFLYL